MTDHSFTGQEQDVAPSGQYPLYDFLAREYNPTWGRWLSPDPMGGNVTNPQSFNRYAYVDNNPASFTDPTGLDPCSDPSYYYSHAECGGPPPGDCEEYDLGDCGGNPFPPLGGYGGGGGAGGGGSVSSAPPAGQPPLAGENFVGLPGCINVAAEVNGIAAAVGGALHTPISPSQVQFAGVGSGGENIFNISGLKNVDISQLANTTVAHDPFHPQTLQILVTEPKNIVPSPGKVIHVLFDARSAPGGSVQDVAIYNIQAHVDIYSPRNSAQSISPGGAVKHGLIDVGLFTALEFFRRAAGLQPCGYKFD